MKRYRLFIAAGLAAVFAVASIGSVLAAWCWSDPVLGIQAPGMQEAEISIDVGVGAQDKNKVSLVKIVVTVPKNVTARVVSMDNVLPEQVTIIKSNETWQPGQTVKVNANVVVLATSNFATAYTIRHPKADGTVEVITKTGTSNSWTAEEFGLFVRN